MSEIISPPTKITSADNLKFRASSNDNLMTNDRSGKNMGDTCKKELLKVFVREKYGRYEEINSKYLDKGNEREPDSITLLSCVTKKLFTKNNERLTNEFITGEPDLFIGKSIHEADEILDIKTSWSIMTFLNANADDYYWQMQSYMALTGAKKATVAHCLVNGTAQAIIDEKRKASYRFGIDFENDPKYVEKCKQIEINFIFDAEAFALENPGFDLHNDFNTLAAHNIPMEERLHTVTFERNEDEIKALYERIKICRNFLNTNLFKL